MRRLLALLASLGLGACSLSGVVTRNSIDYNQTVEDVTNNMLVVNILRARDGVPMYFTDLSQIRGSMQMQAAGTVTAPFGNADLSNQRTRNIAGGAFTISTSPSFDLAPLNNKDFASGLMRPVDLAYLQDYLGQGVPQMLLMHLMVDRIEFVTDPTKTTGLVICSYANTPASFRVSGESNAGPCPPRVVPRTVTDFESLVSGWTLPLIVHNYTALRPFGPEMALGDHGSLRDITSASKPDLVLRPVRGRAGHFQLFTTKAATAFCIPALDNSYLTAGSTSNDTTNQSDAPKEACYQSQVVVDDKSDSQGTPGLPKAYVYLRSIQGMFQYLGQLMRVEKTNERLAQEGRPTQPLPLNFHIEDGASLGARFNVGYDGDYYHVDDNGPHDDTLRILAILNQLLNTIKNANEIPSTKAVEALP